MPKYACLQMVEQLHLANGWRPHQAVLLLMPTVHSPPMSHDAINLLCLHVLAWIHRGASSPWLLRAFFSVQSSCPCWSSLERFYVHAWVLRFISLIVTNWSCGCQLSQQRQNGLAKACCDTGHWRRRRLWAVFVSCCAEGCNSAQQCHSLVTMLVQ